MLHVPLARLLDSWRDVPPPHTLQQLLEGSVRVQVRVARLALREIVARYPNERLGPVELDARFVVDETSVRIDLDLEAERIPLAQAADSE